MAPAKAQREMHEMQHLLYNYYNITIVGYGVAPAEAQREMHEMQHLLYNYYPVFINNITIVGYGVAPAEAQSEIQKCNTCYIIIILSL